MGKIIKITDKVSVGDDNGKIYQISKENLDFEPAVGMDVELYTSESEIIIIPKKEDRKQDFNLVHQDFNQNFNKVHKVTYVLLALFLGGIGIHKFYAGKNGQGILYILFCWTFIPGFISFIEAIVALDKRSDKNGRIHV